MTSTLKVSLETLCRREEKQTLLYTHMCLYTYINTYVYMCIMLNRICLKGSDGEKEESQREAESLPTSGFQKALLGLLKLAGH